MLLLICLCEMVLKFLILLLFLLLLVLLILQLFLQLLFLLKLQSVLPHCRNGFCNVTHAF